MKLFGRKKDSSASMVYENVKQQEKERLATMKSEAKLEAIKAAAIKDAKKESMGTWERFKTGAKDAKDLGVRAKNSKTTKTIGKAAKGLLGSLKKAGGNFKRNTSGANPMIGGSLGASIQESKTGKKLEPKMPTKKKRVVTYYE